MIWWSKYLQFSNWFIGVFSSNILIMHSMINFPWNKTEIKRNSLKQSLVLHKLFEYGFVLDLFHHLCFWKLSQSSHLLAIIVAQIETIQYLHLHSERNIFLTKMWIKLWKTYFWFTHFITGYKIQWNKCQSWNDISIMSDTAEAIRKSNAIISRQLLDHLQVLKWN